MYRDVWSACSGHDAGDSSAGTIGVGVFIQRVVAPADVGSRVPENNPRVDGVADVQTCVSG